jgi:hypothetical protein
MPIPEDMIISDEQVRLALGYLQSAHDERRTALVDTSADSVALVQRVRAQLDAVPETREDRIAEARDVLEHAGFDSGEVASKMIGRAISDSLR